MDYKLSEISDYVKGKIDIAALDANKYISTENMRPDKGGITSASSLPTMVQTQAFSAGDVLVSNIRPYFKKIWFAEYDGGCSNDVLVFRAKDGVNKRFLYYVLSDDRFFEYSMATSKGTKMPRGDKVAIMKYKVPYFTWDEQERIAGILATIDGRIKLNTEINENLSDQIQAIYSNEFDPTTHTPSGVLADICTYSSDKIPVSELSVSTYYSTENMQPNKMGSVDATSLPSITQTTGCHKGDVLISNIRPYFKKIVYVTDDSCGCSTDVLCFVPKEDRCSAFLFGTLYMDRFFDYMVAGSKGTKMPRGDKQQIMNYPIVLPDKESLDLFNGLIVPMLDQIATNRIESSRLAALRDALLPKLMSGELDVSSTDL